jgi:biopolymer transport protein ExbD
MAEKQRELDLWIVQTNTVYRKVPYLVVTNWIQEGRLLAEDRVRALGAEKWHKLGDVPALAAFLPRPEPFQAEDQAEALEPVEVGLSWGAGRPDEEEDVDMIPLIDVSLVLLVFFMMTAAVGVGFFSAIETPSANTGVLEPTQDRYWVGIDTRDPEGQKAPGQPVFWYSLGKGSEERLVKPTRDAKEVTTALEKELARIKGPVKVRIRGDRTAPYEAIRDMTLHLQRVEAQVNRSHGTAPQDQLKIDVQGEVSEPQR